ncbi:MAG: hypothetical protein AB1758_29440 [Candidatus Eremiobacterota bacterium]
MLHNVVNTTFVDCPAACYQCGGDLPCHACELMEANPWKLTAGQLRALRDELAGLEAESLGSEPGAAVCPSCGLLLACPECRLASPITPERIDQRARARTRKSRSAA